jgi:hypothetical protein
MAKRNGLITSKPSRILSAAADVLESRGLAKGTTFNGFTGEIDVIGSLQLASGVNISALTDDIGEAAAIIVPEGNLVGFLAAFEAVDSETDGVYEWQDSPSVTTDTAVSLLRKLSDFYARSPILN